MIVPWTSEETDLVRREVRNGTSRSEIQRMLLSQFNSSRTLSAIANKVTRTKKEGSGNAPQKWSVAENERLFELLNDGTPLARVAEILSEEFHTNRTPRKVSARVTWLKKQRQEVTSDDPAGQLCLPPESSTSTTPEPSERKLQCTYPEGEIAIAVRGRLPSEIQRLLGELVWS
jgi:hypothetical protein